MWFPRYFELARESRENSTASVFGPFESSNRQDLALGMCISNSLSAHPAVVVLEEQRPVTVTPGALEGEVLERGPSPDPFNFLSTYWGSICYSWCLKDTAAGVVSVGRSQTTQYRSNARESLVRYLQETPPSSHISNASVPKCAQTSKNILPEMFRRDVVKLGKSRSCARAGALRRRLEGGPETAWPGRGRAR